MAEIAQKDKNGTVVIEAVGDLGIQDAARFAEAVRGGCAGDGEVLLDLSRVTAFDLSCLQVLYAAQRGYEGRSGLGRLRTVLSEAVMQTILDIGLEPPVGAEGAGKFTQGGGE